MAIKTWMSGLLLAGSLASALPGNAPRQPSSDDATLFVNELIANATAEDHPEKRALTCQQNTNLVVNTGYAKYRGYSDAATGLNHWKGIRYSQALVGSLRWKAPRFPNLNLSAPITDATAFGASCPRSPPKVPGASPTPGDEDCLFLNVAAPPGATRLPVMVWIHGGGYGLGDGSQNLSELINDNGKGFVGVSINYRLGAFGWLSSQEVKDNGVVNAGLLDQALALIWVKSFICQFGGDPSKVTIAGQSAGGGSVMYHDIAVNGGLGSILFERSIAQSPYLPYQPNFNAPLPTSRYYAFSAAAGCPSSGSVISCLRSKSSADLQAASFAVTASGVYGTWGFWPVTDGVYVKNLPSQQLRAKNVNGKKILAGYNAHEGPLFVPRFPPIVTESDLLAWIAQQFPNLSPAQLNLVLAANPNSALTNATAPKFETDGLNTGGYNALNTGADANGQQQRGNNIYAEAVFACPAYWLAEAYSANPGKSGYLYQFSVPFAWHGADLAATFGPDAAHLPSDFTTAWRKAWGNFIISGNPSITNVEANGANSAVPTAPHPLSAWPTFHANNAKLANFNTTGGVPVPFNTRWGTSPIQLEGPTVRNAITVANANSWEAYRGDRCDFYRNLGPSIPA